MSKKIDLTTGNIIKKLLIVASPVVLTSLVQMAYNLTDMYWVSNVDRIGLDGTKAVAGLGTAGFYMWLAFGFILLSKVGTEINVSQNAGANKFDNVKHYARNGIKLTILIGFIYSLLGVIFKHQIIGIFNIEDAEVVNYSVDYLNIISIFMLFYFLNPVFAGIYNGLGKSYMPLIISSVGLVLNMILDPIFIYVFELGIKGAAYATVISQFVVTSIFIIVFLSFKNERSYINIFNKVDFKIIKKILKVSIPPGLHSMLFTLISTVIAVMVATFDYPAIATNRVGSQIESLAWLVASGFQVAMVAFMGQNLGALKTERIKTGYYKALKIMSIYGIAINIILFVFAKQLFGIFIDDPNVLPLGITYLKILSLSQVFMVVEIITQGAFNGLGETKIPSFVGIIFNLLRIPLAYFLSKQIGLNGIWWAIVISSVLKGIITPTWYLITIKGNKLQTIVNNYKETSYEN